MYTLIKKEVHIKTATHSSKEYTNAIIFAQPLELFSQNVHTTKYVTQTCKNA